ncbi:MAG: hypothetical protein IT516_06000 [Burkholderiales bacterium]|nr:hypothetical protein [Burkholderiales bacterium]
MKRQAKALLGIVLAMICTLVLVAVPRPTHAGQETQAGADVPLPRVYARSVADLFPRGR